MSAYRKVAAAKARLEAIKAKTGRKPVQALAFGGDVGSVLGEGAAANAGMAAFGPMGAAAGLIPGVSASGLGGALTGLNPFTAVKNHFSADAPVSAQYNFADPARAAEQQAAAAQGALGTASGSLGVLGAQQNAFGNQLQGNLGAYGNLPGQQQTYLGQVQGNAGAFGNIGAQQQALAAQLGAQAQGGGPNPAQAQFAQNIGAGLAENESAVASTRGLNPALAAHMAAQSNARLLGQGAASEATLQAQQQLAAQGQLAGLQQGMGQQQLAGQAQAIGLQQQLAQQQLAQQSQVAQQQQAQAQTIGAQGQIANQQGALGANLYGTNVAGFGSQEQRNVGANLAAQQINAGVASGNAAQSAGMFGGLLNAGGAMGASALGGGGGAGGGAAGGGGAAMAGGEPGLASAAILASRGGQIPGQPEVPYDSEENDTVNTKLSKGEIVIPLHITQAPNAPELAAEFVRGVLHGKGPRPRFKMAEGGEAEAPDEGRASDGFSGVTGPGTEPVSDWDRPLAAPSPQIQFGSGALPTGGSFGQMPAAPPAQNPNTLPPLGGGQPNQSKMLPVPANPMAAMDKAFGAQAGSGQMMAEAAQQEGEEKAAAFQKQVADVQAAGQVREQAYAKLDAENAELTKSYMNGQVDPNRIWANASTGGKIAAAIGVALSGLGSGLTGQPNAALGVINKLVDEDVKAQYADLGKKHSLLALNLQKYGRIDAAYAATMAQTHAIVAAQVGEAAANAEGPKAAAQAQMLGGQIGLQKAQLQQQVAQMQTAQAVDQAVYGGGGGADGGGAGGGGGGITRAGLEQLAPYSPHAAELSKKAVDVRLPNGKTTLMIARNEKDASEAQDKLAGHDVFEGQLDRGIRDLQANGRSMSGADRKKAADSLHRALTVQLNEQFGLKRLTDTELKEYQEMVPTSTDWNQGGAMAKYGELKQLISARRQGVISTLSGGQRPLAPAGFTPLK